MLLTFDYLQAVLLAVDQLVAVSVFYVIAIVVQKVQLSGVVRFQGVKRDMRNIIERYKLIKKYHIADLVPSGLLSLTLRYISAE